MLAVNSKAAISPSGFLHFGEINDHSLRKALLGHPNCLNQLNKNPTFSSLLSKLEALHPFTLDDSNEIAALFS